jgi:hypothetical protein
METQSQVMGAVKCAALRRSIIVELSPSNKSKHFKSNLGHPNHSALFVGMGKFNLGSSVMILTLMILMDVRLIVLGKYDLIRNSFLFAF